jgi:nucleotide-binding universal stress UspA family protein
MNMTQLYKRVSLNNILFLTDFSSASEWALPFVREIAQKHGAKVTALHVQMPDALTYMTPDSLLAAIESRQDAALAKMKHVEVQLADIPNHVVVVPGKEVWKVVGAMLQQEQADLIIVGTRGRTGFSKMLLGSTAEEIFRRSPVPVMTIGPYARVNEQCRARWQRVIFASNFSPESLAAAGYAISFAEENDAQLTFVHVVEACKHCTKANKNRMTVAEALHQLHVIVPPEAGLRRRPETVVEHGDPAARILALANQTGTDLIVLGVRSTSHALVTSHLEKTIAHRIVVDAVCPVLTVRSQIVVPPPWSVGTQLLAKKQSNGLTAAVR